MRTRFIAVCASSALISVCAGAARPVIAAPPAVPNYGGKCKPFTAIQPRVIHPIKVTRYGYPSGPQGPRGITAGPDGNVWFVDAAGNYVAKVTPNGAFTTYPIPTPSSEPAGITTGPDGNVWFTEWDGNKIGRITPSGAVTEFPLPSLAGPFGIATGPDGNVWFAEHKASIGKITPSGAITEYPYQGNLSLEITAGPDGNVWFTDLNADEVGKMTPQGVATVYPQNDHAALDGGIMTTLGDIWFADPAGRLARMTTSGRKLRCYSTGAQDYARGPGGGLWFGRGTLGGISELDMLYDNRLAVYNLGQHAQPLYITLGPDGNLWTTLYTPHSGYQIAKITLP